MSNIKTATVFNNPQSLKISTLIFNQFKFYYRNIEQI